MKWQAHFESPIASPCCTRARSSRSEQKKKFKPASIRAFASFSIVFRMTWPALLPSPITSTNIWKERRHSNDNGSKGRGLRPGMLLHPGIHNHLPHERAAQQGHRLVPHLSALCRGPRARSPCALRGNQRRESEGGAALDVRPNQNRDCSRRKKEHAPQRKVRGQTRFGQRHERSRAVDYDG